jgi:hypothetical protein
MGLKGISTWAAAAVVFAMLAGLVGTPAAVAASTVGNFEIDGNRADDSGPGDPIDWDTPPFGVTQFTDPSGSTDDILGQGSKELEPGGWSCVVQSAPGKDDIVNGAVAFRIIDGKEYLYVNFQRATTTGDAHMDYEFNQSDEPNPACPELPRRTNGDILITFDTEQGGKIILVRAFRWAGDAMAGRFEELELGSQGIFWDAAVNIPSTIPGVEAGAFGEAAINLTDTIGGVDCLLFSSVYMKTRASTSISAELKDHTDALPVNFAVDRPDLANASGSAYGAQVDYPHLAIDLTLAAASSSQSGVGSSGDFDQVLAVDVPADGSILQSEILTASSTSTVSAGPGEARQVSVAEVANLNLLNGLVKASAVRGVATATANGTSSSTSTTGSTLKGLEVNGVAHNDVTPNTRIDLSSVYGAGSEVLLYEVIASTSRPPASQRSEGTYAADLTVNMIRVHLADALPDATVFPGDQPLDVVVAQANGHADFPQTPRCGAPDQAVAGHAFVASERTDPAHLPARVGFVSIPATGGHQHQDLDEVTTSLVTAGAAVSDSAGTLGSTESSAASLARVSEVCLLPGGGGGCSVAAKAVTAASRSNATAAAASSNDGETALLALDVAGTAVAADPPPNTVVDVPGIGFVILNEQFCDNGADLAAGCSDGTGQAGLTVRAIRLVVTRDNALGVPLGTEVIVSEAYSAAFFAR